MKNSGYAPIQGFLIDLDGVVYKASVTIDGRRILENGRLLLE